MSKEAPTLQYDMFSGELVDGRSTTQKRADKDREKPQQTEMFSQRELAQYVNPHPVMDVSPGVLVLISEDPRTPEEIERDTMKAAEKLTVPLFNGASPPALIPENTAPKDPASISNTDVHYQEQYSSGLREQLRQALIPLRSRRKRGS